MRKDTTHLVLNDDNKNGKLEIWSEHRSHKSALAACKRLGKSGKQGWTTVMSRDDFEKYQAA